MRKELLVLISVVGILGSASLGFAANRTTTPKAVTHPSSTTSPAKTTAATRAYLGIGVESLPAALTAQMPKLLGDGSGVLIAAVAPKSPAAKAGLKLDDILVSFDNQRLYSAEQVVKLVRNDRPDRQVELGVIHDGKLETLKVTLGERPASAMDFQSPAALRRPLALRTPRAMSEKEQEAQWKSFDALTLTQTSKNHFKVQIKYHDAKGKSQSCTYQGTRKQIRKDIDAQKDLPVNQRATLLRAMAMSSQPLEMDFPFDRLVPADSGVLWDFIEPAPQTTRQ